MHEEGNQIFNTVGDYDNLRFNSMCNLMRRPERIPIVLDAIEGHESMFLQTIGVGEDSLLDVYSSWQMNWKEVEDFWLEHPDLRLVQVLDTLHIADVKGTYFCIEEVDWLIKNEVLEPRDIVFWGSNVDKEGNRLEETKWRLIKDLEYSHIKAIIDNNFTSGKILELMEDELNRRELNKQEEVQSPKHYDNSKGSLYLFAEQHELNSWEFDILKRVIRCRKKGMFKEDLEKTKFLIDLYIKEWEQ